MTYLVVGATLTHKTPQRGREGAGTQQEYGGSKDPAGF